jgi:Zn-dependent peptidase ImmA (M78 family)/DNA-binding XRE family transcriptional regulator
MVSDILTTLDPQLLGARLQEARKASGLTQDAVAASMEMARTTIVAIEKGERRLTPHELIKLAGLYGVSVSRLIGRPQQVEALVPQFRAAWKPDAELEACASELQKVAEDYYELERLCDRPLARNYPNVYEFDDGTPDQAGEEIAQRERHRLGLGDGPVQDLGKILESDVGLRVFRLALPSKVAGLFAYNDTLGGCIAVNGNHPGERANWSLAHEFGHFLTTRYQSEVTFLFADRPSSRKERFAEAFAKYFLMPSSGLNRRFMEVYRANQRRMSLADILNLADLFRVSVQAMVLRLEELQRLPAGTWDRLAMEGFKPRQAQRVLGISHASGQVMRLPRRYTFLVGLAYWSEKITEGQAARFLRIDRVSARAVLDEIHKRSEVAPGNDDLADLDLRLSEELVSPQ